MTAFQRGFNGHWLGIVMMCLTGCSSPVSYYFSDSADQALAEAARLGDIDAVDAAIADGADVNASGIDGVTPLYYVYLEAGSLTGYEELLKRGADPNILDVTGKSMMHNAARNASTSAWLQLSLEYGGNPNIQEEPNLDGFPPEIQNLTESGITPIFSAITSGRLESVELLVEHGADISIADKLRGWTPVVYSSDDREPIITRWLIEQGAKWDDQTTTGVGLAEAELRHTFDEEDEKEEFEAHNWILEFLDEQGVDLETAEARSREIYGSNFRRHSNDEHED